MKKWTTPYDYQVNNLGLPEGCIQFATYSIKNSINPPDGILFVYRNAHDGVYKVCIFRVYLKKQIA